MTDLLRRADAFVGVRYLLHGEGPDGWDCLGCIRYLRRELFGKPTPAWGLDYGAADTADSAKAEGKLLAGADMGGWRVVWTPDQGGAPPPGSVLLLTRVGRAAHVGLALDGGQFIHCDVRQETAIEPLAGKWGRRILAAYDAS